MKTFITVLLILTPLFSISQNPWVYDIALEYNESSGRYFFTSVEQLDGLTSSEIYNKTKEFLVRNLNSNSFSIDSDSKEIQTVGKINTIYKTAVLKDTVNTFMEFIYDLNIQFRDGRYRINATNFRFTSNMMGFGDQMAYENLLSQTQNSMFLITGINSKKTKESIIKSTFETSLQLRNGIEKMIKQLNQFILSQETIDDDW